MPSFYVLRFECAGHQKRTARWFFAASSPARGRNQIPRRELFAARVEIQAAVLVVGSGTRPSTSPGLKSGPWATHPAVTGTTASPSGWMAFAEKWRTAAANCAMRSRGAAPKVVSSIGDKPRPVAFGILEWLGIIGTLQWAKCATRHAFFQTNGGVLPTAGGQDPDFVQLFHESAMPVSTRWFWPDRAESAKLSTRFKRNQRLGRAVYWP